MSDKSVYVLNGAQQVMGTIGMIISVILSSALNHSFWWGVLHLILGWIYVVYAVIVRSSEIIPAFRDMFM